MDSEKQEKTKLTEKEISILIDYGFSMEDIVKKLNGEKLISEEVGAWLLERELLKSNRDQIRDIHFQLFNWDEHYLSKNWKQQVLLDYIFKSKNFDVLKLGDGFFVGVLSFQYCIPLINEVIPKYLSLLMNQFFLRNFEILERLFSNYKYDMPETDFLLMPQTRLSKEEVVYYVILYLMTLDGSGRLKDEFVNGVHQGFIGLWGKDEEGDRLDFKERVGKVDSFLAGALDGDCCFEFQKKLFINVLLTGGLQDVFAVVHEFFHKYTFNGQGFSTAFYGFPYKLYPYQELTSIFFERNLRNFLIENGFSAEEVMLANVQRDLNYHYCKNNYLELVNMIRKRLIDEEKITLNDFSLDNESFLSMYNLNSPIAKEEIKDKELKIKLHCVSVLKDIMFNFRSSYYSLSSYLLSEILVDYLLREPEKSVPWMLRFSKDMSCLDMDPSDIIRMILPAHISILFQHTYKEHGIKGIPILKKTK